MAKRRKRVPRYVRLEDERLESEARGDGANLPPGAIPADLTRQTPHNSYSLFRPYYVDLEITCCDCGRLETWTAGQQKWWYEVARGSLYSTAVRCRRCRRARRGEPPQAEE